MPDRHDFYQPSSPCLRLRLYIKGGVGSHQTNPAISTSGVLSVGRQQISKLRVHSKSSANPDITLRTRYAEDQVSDISPDLTDHMVAHMLPITSQTDDEFDAGPPSSTTHRDAEHLRIGDKEEEAKKTSLRWSRISRPPGSPRTRRKQEVTPQFLPSHRAYIQPVIDHHDNTSLRKQQGRLMLLASMMSRCLPPPRSSSLPRTSRAVRRRLRTTWTASSPPLSRSFHFAHSRGAHSVDPGMLSRKTFLQRPECSGAVTPPYLAKNKSLDAKQIKQCVPLRTLAA